MSTEATPRYWFKNKKYGKGWTPATWEGWAVLAAYVAVLFSYIGLAKLGVYEYTNTGFIIHSIILTAVLLRITFLKGEPLK